MKCSITWYTCLTLLSTYSGAYDEYSPCTVHQVLQTSCRMGAPIVRMFRFLVYLRFIYGEAISALPMNGGAYNVLINTTSKPVASFAACLAVISYIATGVVSAATAVSYLQVYSRTCRVIFYHLLRHGDLYDGCQSSSAQTCYTDLSCLSIVADQWCFQLFVDTLCRYLDVTVSTHHELGLTPSSELCRPVANMMLFTPLEMPSATRYNLSY